MINSKFLLLILFFISQIGFSQIPSGYYNNAEGKTGATLKTALYNIIKNHNSKSYDNLWTYFKNTDKKSSGEVWDMYSNCSFTFVTDQCGEYSNICDCYNREHSFPKSWFDGKSPMVSDLFHIYPTDGKTNGTRSNYAFGENSSGENKVGNCTYPGYSGKVFEPADEYKGDFARTYFYMVTRYEDIVSSWNYDSNGNAMLDGKTFPAFEDWALNMLIEWHNADPVSEKEIDRNNIIYTTYQVNRNPFIDHPEYVADIWVDLSSVTDVKNAGFSIYPNPVQDILSVSVDNFTKELKVSIYNIVGQELISKNENNIQDKIEINMLNLTDGVYFIKIESKDKPAVFQKIVLKK